MKPTPSQIQYAEHLLKQVGGEVPDLDKLTRVELSEIIDGLKKKRGKPVFYGNGQFSHWEKMSLRVVARVKLSGYFSVGDVILFGKYKNKRGVVKRLFIDEKGNPSVEIEPVPKGRKKNKIMGLYKIWKTPEDRVRDKQAALRVVARFQREAAALSDDKMQALLLSLRKGAWGKITSVARLKEVLDRLGGWNVEPFVGLVKIPSYDSYSTGKDYPASFWGSKEDCEEVRKEALKVEVKSLPTNPKADARYTMDVGEVEKGSSDHEVEFRLWIGCVGWKVTSPEGKILELLPDGSSLERSQGWHNSSSVDLRKTTKLGKRATKFIHLYDLPKWLKSETNFEKQLLEVLGMGEHKPAAPRTRENTGSCPCCFRNIKLKAQSGREHPLMVNHGFQRPGWGYIVGNCIGVGWPPFELSPDGTKHLLKEFLHPRVKKLLEYLRRLKAGEVTELHPFLGSNIKVTPDDTNWKRHLENEVGKTERELKWVQEDIKTLEHMVTNWKLEPLPEPGEEIKALKLRSP